MLIVNISVKHQDIFELQNPEKEESREIEEAKDALN